MSLVQNIFVLNIFNMWLVKSMDVKIYGYRWLTVLSLQFCGGWGHLHLACRLFATLLHPNSCILCEFFQSGLDRPFFTLSHRSTWGLNGYMQLLEGDPPGNFQQPQSSTTTITRGKAHSTFRGWSILSRSGLTLLESNCSTEGNSFPQLWETVPLESPFRISFRKPSVKMLQTGKKISES